MRILGVDPGLRATGFGVVESRGAHLAYVASGVIRVPAGELSLRLKAIFDGLAEVIRTYSPQCAAIERVFVNVNPASTLLLGQARGAAITALAAGNLPVAEYAALQIKQAVVGTGRAGKTQVQHMVVRLLALPGTPQADAADALACAVCHAHGSAAGGLLAQAGSARIAAATPMRAASPLAGLQMRRGRLVPS